MAKPTKHALYSVKKYGGAVDDYLPIHNFFDSSKAVCPDIRHRAIFHNAFGIFLLEQVFGAYIINSEGKHISVRDLGEDHVIQDMGYIPTLNDWLDKMPIEEWMLGHRKVKNNHD